MAVTVTLFYCHFFGCYHHFFADFVKIFFENRIILLFCHRFRIKFCSRARVFFFCPRITRIFFISPVRRNRPVASRAGSSALSACPSCFVRYRLACQSQIREIRVIRGQFLSHAEITENFSPVEELGCFVSIESLAAHYFCAFCVPFLFRALMFFFVTQI